MRLVGSILGDVLELKFGTQSFAGRGCELFACAKHGA
jgi:hypothetical protein